MKIIIKHMAMLMVICLTITSYATEIEYESGGGTIENPHEYWEENGYPEYVVFAVGGYDTRHGEVEEAKEWNVGVFNPTETDKQEIIRLLAPNIIVRFTDCPKSSKELEDKYGNIPKWRDYYYYYKVLYSDYELYDDDFGGEYHADGKYFMLVANPTFGRLKELQEKHGYKNGNKVTFIPCNYSYKELEIIHHKIWLVMREDTDDEESGIYHIGVDQRQNHLEVGVDESVYEHYKTKFSELYGDRVFVKVSSSLSFFNENSDPSNSSLSPWLIIPGISLLLGGSLLLWHKLRGKR